MSDLPDFENDDCFVYDPATELFHAVDGGEPEHGVKWINSSTQPTPDLDALREVASYLKYMADMKTVQRIKEDSQNSEGVYSPDFEHTLWAMYAVMHNKSKQALSKLQAIIEKE